jgi:ABC-2 type transport system permease protein
MRAILVLALKDLRLRVREPIGLFWTFVFPLIFALFFGAMFGGDTNRTRPLDVAVIDEDHSALSQALADRLGRSEALNVQALDPAAARDAVRRGRLSAVILIKPGFGGASFFAPSPAGLEVGIDPAQKTSSGYLQGILMDNAFRLLQEQFADPKQFQTQAQKLMKELEQGKGDLKPKDREVLMAFLKETIKFSGSFDGGTQRVDQERQPIRLEVVPITPADSRPKSSYEITFPSSMMWAVLGCVMSFALSIVLERNAGTWLRLRVAPLNEVQLVAGKALASFLGCLAAAGALFLVGNLVFGVRIESLAGMALALVSVAFCFTAVMMLLASLFRSEEALSGGGWGVLMTFALLGGGTIPLVFMPAWMQSLSSLSPVKWGIVALEGAIWRGFTLGDMLLPCGILWGVGLACLAAGVTRLARSEG